MRGVYYAAGERESLAASLWELVQRDGFYVNREDFDAALHFAPCANGVCIEVYAELGENLLVWARQKGLLQLKRPEG